MLKNKRRNLTRSIVLALCLGTASLYNMPFVSADNQVVGNNVLPSGANGNSGNFVINSSGNIMNITQEGQYGYIKWNDFSVGANATVNFNGNVNSYHTLNYVNGGNTSQIYGTINANKNGNIYIVNPSGVQIGNSAQINVGSLYVSNKYLDESKLDNFKGSINELVDSSKPSNAELMSLGNINANNVTFDGDRIVLDVDRLASNTKATVNSTTGNIVLGVDSDSTNTDIKNNIDNVTVNINGTDGTTTDYKYEWVKNLTDLQAISGSGKYALRNSIDAISTKDNTFASIGKDTAFSGTFDGLDYNIFGLTIDSTDNNVGLFAQTDGATIKNFSLVSGSITSTGSNVGAVVGNANNTTIENVTNTLDVTGKENVGGIVGNANNKTTLTDVINTGSIFGSEAGYSNIGGIAGKMDNSTLNGNSYNLGNVGGTTVTITGVDTSHNIGGLVGSAINESVIGNETGFQVYNQLGVEGGYNVGGIVGNLDSSTVQNAANNGTITATGYTTEKYITHTAKDNQGSYNTEEKDVNISNVGGIVGNTTANNDNSIIKDVINTGDISTTLKNEGQIEPDKGDTSYYQSGNVGGIVGSANNTTINNATNKENTIRGAHNIGGIAGALTGSSTITNSLNDGGDIMGTGARNDKDNYVFGYNDSQKGQIGNIGGIAGYLTDNASISGSANRGRVHTKDIAKDYLQYGDGVDQSYHASSIGGIVGEISKTEHSNMENIKNSPETATVNDSYNTGEVQGYMSVGGIAGFMWNGSIANSHNEGNILSSRKMNSNIVSASNIGGIVGDTTEFDQYSDKTPYVILYNVYNTGQIGDENLFYSGRHVGGIAGRLAGYIEKAYNTGNVYNGSAVTGGIAGYWTLGTINNTFNTGNVIGFNTNTNEFSSVGGIVGALANSAEKTISNSYNLGDVISYKANNSKDNNTGGIIGGIRYYEGMSANKLKIENVYTTDNIKSYVSDGTFSDWENYSYKIDDNDYSKITAINTSDNTIFSTLDWNEDSNNLGSIYGGTDVGNITGITNAYFISDLFNGTNQAKAIREAEKDKLNNYSYNEADWRIYDDTTPILNAFISKLGEDNTTASQIGADSIQYGTAENPFLNIIDAGNNNITISGEQLNSVDSVLVNNGSLTVNNLKFDGIGSNFYNGSLTSSGALTVGGDSINLGSTSSLTGSSVTINANDNIKINGTVESTNDGVNITAENGDIEILNAITSKGSTNITAKGEDSNVDIFYGTQGKGFITTGCDLNVKGNDIYIDSDLKIDGSINLNAPTSLLDISNVGQHADDEVEAMHTFLDSLSGESGKITFSNEKSDKGVSTDAMVTIDLWDSENGAFNLDKFDKKDGTTLASKLNALNVEVDGNGLNPDKIQDLTHIWISDADQLKGIQDYKDNHQNSNILNYNFALKNDIDATNLNDYKSISDFKGDFDGRDNRIIGLTSENGGIFNTLSGTVEDLRVYSSTFGGSRDSANVGAIANVNNGTISNATTLGNTVVSNGTDDINGTDVGSAGGIAGINEGTITDSLAIGTVIGGETGNDAEMSAVGGIAGINVGKISNTTSNSAVTSEDTVNPNNSNTQSLGGIAGVNATIDKGNGEILTGTIEDVSSLGVTNGTLNDTPQVGGIVGANAGSATVEGAYNESIVSSDQNNVGGIIGWNESTGKIENIVNASSVTGHENVGGLIGSNGSVLNPDNPVYSSVTNGRNTGEVIGIADAQGNKSNNVGGLVGFNNENGVLKNLINDKSGSVTGYSNVGGVAGTNNGTISGDDELENEGVVTGHENVGGVAGTNNGTIDKMTSNVTLQSDGDGGEFFGGIAGNNTGTISNSNNSGTITTDKVTYVGGIAGQNSGTIQEVKNDGAVNAENASYVGGITGWNRENAELLGKINNEGTVEGDNKVGGIAGINDSEKFNNQDIILTNEGTVLAHNGGAGGIFYENNAKLEGVTLINKGTVTSEADSTDTTIVNATGGVIGHNTGDIEKSSLINESNATVNGKTNVGGVIGLNEGTVTGGRDENGNYYKYQIYNNGDIVGTDNVGGLIGNNTEKGSLTAGYNTGNVTGEINVGGIAGINSGSIDQTFNSNNPNTNKVTGNENVGGLVGNNSGTVSNSYSTATVSGNSNAGNAIGINANNADVENIYSTQESGKLFGDGANIGKNNYTFANGDTTATYISKDNQYDKYSYSGFNDGNSNWKFYDGLTNPLLRVFLTKAVYHSEKEPVFNYTGQPQGFIVRAERNNVVIYGTDGERYGYITVMNKDAAHSLADYFNTNTGAVSDLINGNKNTEVGEYEMLFSQQINTSGKNNNPNNLGFEFVSEVYKDVPIDPTKPEDPTEFIVPPMYNIVYGYKDYDYLYKDQWDRNRNFRERRAEFNYVDGGVQLDDDENDEYVEA